ncbi:DUF4382 domain-containing protein [Chloroflexota bacterium]
MKRGFVFVTILAITAMLLAGCGISGAPSPTPSQTTPESTLTPGQITPESTSTLSPSTKSTSSRTATGTLTVLVTDAPKYEVVNVVVHFSKVEVHKAADGPEGEGEWVEIPLVAPDSQTFDDSYQITLSATMGNVTLAQDPELTAGKYTQIRVYMDEGEDKGVAVTYIPDPEDLDENNEPKAKTVTAKLPSGTLKFVRPFMIEGDADTEILLDFDLQKSVVFTGATQSEDMKVIVKPTVKLQVSMPEGEENEGELHLYEKDPDGVDDISDNEDDWSIVEEGASGKLEYNLSGETFDFEFEGEGLEPDTSYTLIYYADPWPGNGDPAETGAWIMSGTSDGNGELELQESVDLNTDLPNPSDDNYDIPVNGQNPPGAKIWLVLSADYNNNIVETGPMTEWNPEEYLFEGNTVTYDDTDWEPEP